MGMADRFVYPRHTPLHSRRDSSHASRRTASPGLALFLPSDQPPLLSGRRWPADMPRDLFLRPVSCRNGGENEKTLGILISDVLARQLTTPPVCDLVQNEANLLGYV